ncbi:hypothetical protein D3C81_2302180 [compost metagenome]
MPGDEKSSLCNAGALFSVSDRKTVFGRRDSRHLFKGGAKTALTGKACAETDVLDGNIRGL